MIISFNKTMNQDYDCDEIYIKYSTPFNDLHAEQRHDDIRNTFKGLFHQWFNVKGSKFEYLQQFGNEIPTEELLSLSQANLNESLFETLQHLPTNEHSAYCLTMFGFYDFLNKIETLCQMKIMKVDITRTPMEYWFNYRKCETIEPQRVLVQLLPLLVDLKTITAMLIRFIECYDELSVNPAWHKLYTFVFINILNIYEKVCFRPNLKSIGGFVNVVDTINEMEQFFEQNH